MAFLSSAFETLRAVVKAAMQTGTRFDTVVVFRRKAIRIILIFFCAIMAINAVVAKFFYPEFTLNDLKLVLLLIAQGLIILNLPRMRRFFVLWAVLTAAFFTNVTMMGLVHDTGIQDSTVLFAIFMPLLGVYFVGSIGAIGGWFGGLISFTVLLFHSLKQPPPDTYLGGYSQPFDIYTMAVSALTLSMIIALTLHDALLRALLQSRDNLERARRSDTERIRFFGTVSHEVRNSLNGLFGLTTSLLQEELSPQVREKVMLIQASGNSLIGTLNDSLEISRLEYGPIDIVHRPVALDSLIRTAVSVWHPSADAKGLSLTAELPESLPHTVLLDEGRIRQILDNLISNAIKFTPEGHIRLLLDTAEVSETHIELHFRIADTGIGIHPEQLDRIFDPYRQENKDISTRFGGTGLGLYICRLLAEQMGGAVRVEKSDRSGSTFHLVIPTNISAPERPEVTIAGAADNPPLSVLAVDDHEASRNYLKTLLTSWEIPVETVSSGADCLDRLETGRFNLLLLDSNMPGMTGLELLRIIRSLDGNICTIAAIVISADGSERIRHDFRSLAISDFLVKPVTPDMLWRSIKRLTCTDETN